MNKKKLLKKIQNRVSGISILFTFLFISFQGSAQDAEIRGVVSDSGGQPLPGVNIVVKGTTIGTQSDFAGKYALNAATDAVLVFSFVGFKTEEVSVNGRTKIDMQLSENQKNLQEVVVVGYGTQTNRDLSTAISSVGAKALSRQVVSSFENALQGQATGVQVTNPSGAPGSSININIRGVNSVNLTASPLYVIDGVPVQPTYDQEVGFGNQKPNPLSTIDPKDIESIDVLKDGASAAIYGSRASNGVVVITTRRGKSGKAQVTFNTYYGVQQLRKKMAMATGQQFAQLYNEALRNAGKPEAYNPDTVKTNTDWQDLIYRNALIKNYQLSIGGGSEKTKYYVSGSYFNQDGIIRNSGFERYAAKINVDQKVSDKLRIGTSLNLAATRNNRSVRSEVGLSNGGMVIGALQQIPTIPVYKPDGTYALNPFSQSDNPVGNLLESKSYANINQLFGNLYGEFDVLKNLTFRTSAGIDFRSQIENQYVTRQHPGTQNAPSASRGSAQTGTNTQTVWLWENTLTCRPKVNENGSLELLAGFSAQNSNRFTSGASGYGFPSNAVPYLSSASNYNPSTSFEDQWGLVSYFARANYNYKERYYLSLSMRSDGSSRFEKGRRFGYFPAASLAWRVFDENFFQTHSTLSDLKIKASFGANGNQNIGNYDRFSTYGTGYNYTNYTGDGSVAGGIAPKKIGNSRITWETTYQYDIGFDIALFNNRVTVTADVYLKKTKNLLNYVPLSYSSGAEASGANATVIANIGQIQNKGVELAINSTNVRRENGLSWTTNFNISANKNEVLDLGTTQNARGETSDRTIIGDNWIVEKGKPLGSFYGYEVQGIFQTTAEVTAAPRQSNASPGDLRFRDTNGDNR